MEYKYANKINEKNTSKKSNDYINKKNDSNYHIKKNTQINLYEENQRLINKINIKSLNGINNKNLLNQNYNSQIIIRNKTNINRPQNSFYHSTADIFSLTKKINNNINNRFQNSKQQSVNIQQKRKYYLDYLNKKNNAFGEENINFSGNKNKINNSEIQNLGKINPPIEPQTNYNYSEIKKINNQNIKYNDLNRKIFTERKKILDKINFTKVTNNFLTEEYNIDKIIKFNDNSELKPSNNNFYFSNKNNNDLLKTENNKIKLNKTTNTNIFSLKNSQQKIKKNSFLGQYYIDIDLSNNINSLSRDNIINNNRKINKQISYLEKSGNKYKINSLIYNSPLGKNNKNNKKIIVDMKNNNDNFNKKNNFTNGENNYNILSNKSKKIDINRNQNNNKYKCPYYGNKIINLNKDYSNDIQSQYISNHNFNSNNLEKNYLNFFVSPLKESNNISKKCFFFDKDNKSLKDNLNTKRRIKNNEHTPKNKISSLENDLNYYLDQLSVNNKKSQTENKLKKNFENQNYDINNVNNNYNNNKINNNKNNLVNYQNVYLTKNENIKNNYFELYNSIEGNELKKSLLNNNKDYNKMIHKNSMDKNLNLSENYNNKENSNYNDSKQVKRKVDLKDIHFKGQIANIDNNSLNYNINNMTYLSSNNVNKNDNEMQIILSNTDSCKKKISISPTTTIYHNKFNIIQFNGNNNNNYKINNNNDININLEDINSKNYLNNSPQIVLNKNKNNNRINYNNYHTEYKSQTNNELINSNNKNLYLNNNDEEHSLLKNSSFGKQEKNNIIRNNQNYYLFYNSQNSKGLNTQNQRENKINKKNNNLSINQKSNKESEIRQINNNCNNNNIKSQKSNKNNNIINVNNNTSNVSVLNFKNSSINICFEKKPKYKGLSPDNNIICSTNANNSQRNKKNKANVKNVAKELLEKNKNQKNINDKLKKGIYRNNILSQSNSPNYMKISTNTIRSNNIFSINKNDNKYYIINKNRNNNLEYINPQILSNNSEIHLFKSTELNKEFLEDNIKFNIKDFGNKIITNSIQLNNPINNYSLNNQENFPKQVTFPFKEKNSKKISGNISINKEKKINNKNTNKKNCTANNNYKFKKIDNITEINNNSKGIKLPGFSTDNTNGFIQTKYVLDNIYQKPSFYLSNSKSKKNKTHSKIKLKNYNFSQRDNIYFSNKSNLNKDQKSLNTSASNIIPFKNKLNCSLNISQSKLKEYHSERDINDISIEKSLSEKRQEIIYFNNLSEDSIDINKIRNIYSKSYSFIHKYYKYYIKIKKINKCYFNKKHIIKEKLNKETDIKLNLLNKINKEENFYNKIDNNKIFNSFIEDQNKEEILNNNDNTNKKNLSNLKIYNEDEKINESSQNGLIVTFGEVNYNKKNSSTMNYRNNDLISQYNNDIINDESDLDIYKKLDIIQQESQNKAEDNISENEDIKLCFSDEADTNTCLNFNNPTNNSNKIIDYHLPISTNGKEIEDIDEKICKTYKKNILDSKYNLENAEKGLIILKKIALRRGYRSDDEKNCKNNNNNIREKKQNNLNMKRKNEKICLGTNKLNEIFNNKKEIETSDNNDNDSFEKEKKYILSRSVNKDILKGISKIENFFEKKCNSNMINSYRRNRNCNKNNEYSNDTSCNIDDLLDYNEEENPKVRTYVQKMKDNIYFQNTKNEKEIKKIKDKNNNNSQDIYYLNEYNSNSNFKYKKKMKENNFDNNLKEIDIKISNKNKSPLENIEILNKKEKIKNKYSLDLILSYKKNIYSLKQTLLNQETINHCNELLFNIEENYDLDDEEIIQKKNKKEENNYSENLIEKPFKNNNNFNKIKIQDYIENSIENNSKEESIPLENESINYSDKIKKSLSKNRIKYDILNLLNIITEEIYYNIYNRIAEIILYDNNEKEGFSTERLNNNENIIKNEHIFKEIIFKKGTSEIKYSSLYAELCHDLDIKINSALIEQRNTKNNKEKKLKYIINEECINLMHKYKENSKDIINISNKESDEFFLLKKNLIGYVSFIYELINKKVLKQQFGYNLLEQFFKKYNDKEMNDIIKILYLEVCIILLDKLGKIVYEKNNRKYIQNLNNFINNNLINIINNNDNIPSYLKYRIINIIKKNENLWRDSASENLQKEKNLVLEDSDSEENEISDKKIISNKNSCKTSKNNIFKEEYKSRDENELLIEEDLLNYISYFTEKSQNGQVIIKNIEDKSYNWKVIDELINEKKIGLEFIIDEFIQICTYTIHDENQLILSNNYIKNIIEYYSGNLQKYSIDLIHTEMIKTFLIIDEFIDNNKYMYNILGNLLFILIENKLYLIKYLNRYLKAEKKTKINLANIAKYCIISSGKFAKKYFNDFKQTKLFNNNEDIFEKYIKEELKDLYYFIK